MIGKRIKGLFKTKALPAKVIFIGIGYPCFVLAKSLLDTDSMKSQPIEITAFINDEPWTNRTQVHGVTVYSPSEISALINKHKVKLLIQIQGESITIADNIWQDIFKTKATLITLKQGQTLADQQQIIYGALAKHTL